MECRNIKHREFEAILSEMRVEERKYDLVGATPGENELFELFEAISGKHDAFGTTVLLREGARFMAFVADPTPLDRFLAVQSFMAGGKGARTAGRG